MNNYTLYECTHRCITYSVTAHPDDGQARPKHVVATNSENMHHLCILLILISNYTTMHGVEHIKTALGIVKCKVEVKLLGVIEHHITKTRG
jgi:hypothetical protein